MRCSRALGIALSGVLVSSSVWALSIKMEPAAPVPMGQAQTFRVAQVLGAVGTVNLTWDFGDGTAIPAPSPALTASHTYKDAGHYTVIVQATDSAASVSASFVQTAHYPLTAVPPHNSSSIIYDPQHHQIWNANPDADSVSVSDAQTGQRQGEIPVGREPHTLAQAPDGSIWVANQRSDEVLVLDRSNGVTLARIALPYASQPLAIAFGPTGMAYVSLFATAKLAEIDGQARKLGRIVAVGPTPAGVSVASDGRIFVTRFVSPVDHGEVRVLSPQSLAVTNTIELPFDMTPDSSVSGRGVPNFVSSIAISPDGTQGWVSAKKDDVARGPQRDGQPMNSDNFVRAIVCVIDMKKEVEIVERRQDLDNRSMPASIVFSPVGDYAYLSLVFNNEISTSDAYNLLNLGAIRNVGSGPDGAVLTGDGQLFVNAFLSREVIAYDMSSSLASIDQTAPPPLMRIRAIDHEPFAPDVLLGKQTFFNAMDTRMSAVGYMSCGTCHFAGLSDGRVWDFTDRGEGLRNTKSLIGIRGAKGEGRLHWSANMDEIQDFERDIRDSQGGSGFMSDAEFDARKTGPGGTYDTFGKPAVGASKELDALAAYLTSLDKVPPSPYRNPDGSFTKDALAGRQIFVEAGCPECHSGPDFTDSAKGQLHDVGTILPTSGHRLGGPLTGTDTPQLKGIWQTAPYLHDGRAATLLEIFTKYLTRDQMGMTSHLTTAELEQLVEYLQELDDVPEAPLEAPPPASTSRFHCTFRPAANSSTHARGDIWMLAVGVALWHVRAIRHRDVGHLRRGYAARWFASFRVEWRWTQNEWRSRNRRSRQSS
jgi:DNA-binding beta-propeller fold protein YncE